MSKVVAPRDTKPDSGRKLTKSNLLSVPGSSEKEIRRLYFLKLDNPRISLDRKFGQAFSDHEIFTKSHAPDFHSGKTLDRSILRVKTRDSPRTLPAGESIIEKRGPQFYSRDPRVMFERFPITGVASQFYLKTQHACFLVALPLIRRSGTGGIRPAARYSCTPLFFSRIKGLGSARSVSE